MTHPQAQGYYEMATDRINLKDRLQHLFETIDDLRSDVLIEMRDTIGDHLTISSSHEVQDKLRPTYDMLQHMLHALTHNTEQ